MNTNIKGDFQICISVPLKVLYLLYLINLGTGAGPLIRGNTVLVCGKYATLLKLRNVTTVINHRMSTTWRYEGGVFSEAFCGWISIQKLPTFLTDTSSKFQAKKKLIVEL